MDSLRTGSDELVYIQTDKVSVTIKGRSAPVSTQKAKRNDNESVIKVSCNEDFVLSLKGVEPCLPSITRGTYAGVYSTQPLFFEQQNYELIVEATEGHEVAFWHDNLSVRNKITKASRRHEILSGVINFGNEIGFSDLIILLDGAKYLGVVIEVFPTKISYKEDYQSIVEDVTKEVYNIVFDFLKKTYQSYQLNDRVSSSPVEFFAVIRKIYGDFLRAIDIILKQPHHMLDTFYEVLPEHKVKRTNIQTRHWLNKHPMELEKRDGRIAVHRALAVRKQVTYDTKENRLTKYIMHTVMKKLESFKQNYTRLGRECDKAIISELDRMSNGINKRISSSFLSDISLYETSSSLSQVFSMASGYRELYKLYLMLLRGLSISGDVFNISMKDLAILYEYWCFIKINSMMKERYELVSQDIVKIHGKGLFVSLVKGQASRVRYRNPENNELITLSYNPMMSETQTVTQRPDNVLSLQKQGENVKYEYIFDAKYRINLASPGTDYYNNISHKPGPVVEDINTMHRYRDAILFRSGASAYERTMFGAYVLFPYQDEDEYIQHRFFKSISEVNIGGLPFLPSATSLVSGMLEELISDSPESAFERAILPRGIEAKLTKIDWSVRDVLVGSMRSREQLDACLKHNYYYIPVSQFKESDFPIRYIAIYQSKNLFGASAGIRYYGEVTTYNTKPRYEIKDVYRNSTDLYYLFCVKEWKSLSKPITPKERGSTSFFSTNLFLLEHSTEVPELWLRSEEEYRLNLELRRATNNAVINDESANLGFKFNNSLITFEDGKIRIYRNRKAVAEYEINDFTRTPNAVFRRIHKEIESIS